MTAPDKSAAEVKNAAEAWWDRPHEEAPFCMGDMSHGCEQIVPYPPTEKQEVGDA